MSDRTEFKCDHCKKVYASYKSRWLHIKKYHNTKVNQKLVNVSNDISNNVSQKLVNNVGDNIIKAVYYKCKICSKEYKHRSSKSKHEKTCKTKDNKQIDINQIKNLENQIIELKELLLKSMKIHPKTLQKINNQLNNNGVINNNIVIQVGNEDFNKVLSENEKLYLLNKYANSLVEMVKKVHISDEEKFKPYKSMYITNLQNNVAYRYDEGSKKFIVVTKNELLDLIIENRLADIENFHEDYKKKITPFTSEQITKFIERMNNEKDYKDVKKEQIKFAIYNGREKIIEQIKENNPDLNIFT